MKFQKRKVSASNHPAQSSCTVLHHYETKNAHYGLNSMCICSIFSGINTVFDGVSGDIFLKISQHFFQMLKLNMGLGTCIYYICTTI